MAREKSSGYMHNEYTEPLEGSRIVESTFKLRIRLEAESSAKRKVLR